MLQLEWCEGSFPLRGIRRVGQWDDGSGRLCAVPYESPDGPVIHWPGVGWYQFDETGRVRCWPDEPVLHDKAEATFERLRPLILQRLGLEALHASAIATDGGVVALCGASGTGKSTLAYAFAQRGYEHVADDFLALDFGDRIYAQTFPFELRLRPASRLHLGAVEVRTHVGQSSRVPMSAIVLLRRHESEGPASIALLEPAAAFAPVLAHAHSFSLDDDGRRRRTIEHYLRVVRSVPVFDCAFESGFERLPHLVSDLERAIARPGVQARS